MSQNKQKILPFTSIIGQEQMKLSLILNAINPRIGGVLIRGDKGTAKSTAVRALSGILPEISTVNGCSFSCDPYNIENLCPFCKAELLSKDNLDIISRPVKVITLPLGATEDRVIGTLDIQRAIKEGISALDAGILAAAHRGILYIDEVNLLDDHVVDLLLDAAAMGMNIIERENISVSHLSHFILIGTMNPEEGELRPQLLDRFGLMVTVEGITDPDQRIAVIESTEKWENNPDKFEKEQLSSLQSLRNNIVSAQKILSNVTIDKKLMYQVVEACISLGIMTHRAEITIIRTAKTIAAFNGRMHVTSSDIKDAMNLALPHRMRKKPFEEPKIDPKILEEFISEDDMDHPQDDNTSEKNVSETEIQQNNTSEKSPLNQSNSQTPKKHEIGTRIDSSYIWDKQNSYSYFLNKSRGKRISSPTDDIRGRRISTTNSTDWKKISFDATFRAAAPYQLNREKKGLSIIIYEEDIRKSRRTGKVEMACVFVVDASGSMGAQQRMESTKGAILSLLEDAYINRDKVSLVAFRGTDADILLPLCRSPDLAYKRLSNLPTGGKTPLSLGLLKGIDILQQEKRKNKDLLQMLFLISDGRANIGSKPISKEIQEVSGAIVDKDIRTVIIDTESISFSQSISLGYCKEIAQITQGSYFSINELTPEVIETIARDQKNLFVEEYN